MTAPLILFVRVPKTATSLLDAMLQNLLGAEAVLNVEGRSQNAIALSTLSSLTDGHRVVSAHMPVGLHAYLARETEYVTLLRDPVDRVASLFHHVQADHHRTHWLHRPGMTIAQWVTDCAGPNTQNAAVRYLSGMDIKSGASMKDFAPVCRRHLDLAKQNLLDLFPLVGVVERFEALLRKLEQRYGLPPHHMGHVNGRPNAAPYGERPTDRQALPPGTVAAIDAENRLDLELYEFARDNLAP
ncbi:MAG: sulfotransferase family 2 domain-containing protein [Deltaproteobacteria bacterium]|nr:sulfotransferase family 2 domain-containing protein [Deltaproteobacteria bacterium]